MTSPTTAEGAPAVGQTLRAMAQESWTAVRVGESGFADHTPVYDIRDHAGYTICTAVSEPIANLLAAAPDLFDALLWLRDRLTECGDDPITAAEAYDSFYREIVDEAIAKATGSQP